MSYNGDIKVALDQNTQARQRRSGLQNWNLLIDLIDLHIFTSKITLLNNIDLRYLQRLTLKKLVYEIREDSTTHDTNYPYFIKMTLKKDQRGH